MDGLTTIKHIMVKNPVPVVMVSGLADQARITFEALRLGAIDFFPKPSGTISKDINEKSEDLIKTLKLAAKANPKAIKRAISSVQKDLDGQIAGDIQGNVLILARQGAVSSFIRLLSALVGLKNIGFVSIQDISETVLSAYTKELSNFFDCTPYVGQKVRLEGGKCVIASENNLPDVRVVQETDNLPILELLGNSATLTEFVEKMASKSKNRLCLVVLGGEIPEDTSFVETVCKAGGQVLSLDPMLCPCSEFSSYIKNNGIGQTLASEMELWEGIRAFSRRLLLEKAKEVSR